MFEYILGLIFLIAGLIFLVISIHILTEAPEVYNEKYDIIKHLQNDKFVKDNEGLENLLSYDIRTGELLMTQQLTKDELKRNN